MIYKVDVTYQEAYRTSTEHFKVIVTAITEYRQAEEVLYLHRPRRKNIAKHLAKAFDRGMTLAAEKVTLKNTARAISGTYNELGEMVDESNSE